MAGLRISLFGRFCVQYEDQLLTGFDSLKVQELFSYLLVYRNQPHSRELLTNLLWNDCSASQSKSYFRKTLWQLQSALEQCIKPENGRFLLTESDYLQFNIHAALWIDIAVFETAFNCCQGINGHDLSPVCHRALCQAVNLYQGYFLEGWYQEWCLFERERLHQLYLMMLDKLMDYAEAHGTYEDGLLYGNQILRYDAARERTHRSLMRLYYLAANRTEALRQYERCTAVLRQELDVDPSRQTTLLYEQIRQDQGVTRAETAVFPSPTLSSNSLLELRHQLEQCQTTLNQMQQHVWHMNHTMQTLLQQPNT